MWKSVVKPIQLIVVGLVALCWYFKCKALYNSRMSYEDLLGKSLFILYIARAESIRETKTAIIKIDRDFA